LPEWGAYSLRAKQDGPKTLATLNDRIAEFTADRLPDDDTLVELLCIDHNGTYVLPFPCRCVDGDWRNSRTGERIMVEVAGWRRRLR
jgi:hypothetical protein